ncbi:hypothetical protein B0H14DRAFT_2654292 [Mycena olivaceomarginata]|nr:hypothetical protein B0H14DRAFT_2654292 [Mycena olivaceomarginata]
MASIMTDMQAARGQITKLALHNWEFPNIGSLIKVIGSAAHLKVLTLTCCSFLSSEGPTPPFERLAFKAIDILEFRHSQLMRDTLRWVSEASLTLATLKIESDDQEYLAYILDNRLGLSFEKFCLVIESSDEGSFPRLRGLLVFPLVHLEIGVQLNTGNDLKVMLQDLSFAVSSAFQSPGSTSQFHLSVWSDTDSEEWETIWGTIDKVVKVESVATSMKIQRRYINTEERSLKYIFTDFVRVQTQTGVEIESHKIDRNETAAPTKSPGVRSPHDVGLSLTEARLGWQKLYADLRQQRRARWWSEDHTNNTGGYFDVDVLTSRSGDSAPS